MLAVEWVQLLKQLAVGAGYVVIAQAVLQMYGPHCLPRTGGVADVRAALPPKDRPIHLAATQGKRTKTLYQRRTDGPLEPPRRPPHCIRHAALQRIVRVWRGTSDGQFAASGCLCSAPDGCPGRHPSSCSVYEALQLAAVVSPHKPHRINLLPHRLAAQCGNLSRHHAGCCSTCTPLARRLAGCPEVWDAPLAPTTCCSEWKLLRKARWLLSSVQSSPTADRQQIRRWPSVFSSPVA